MCVLIIKLIIFREPHHKEECFNYTRTYTLHKYTRGLRSLRWRGKRRQICGGIRVYARTGLETRASTKFPLFFSPPEALRIVGPTVIFLEHSSI